MPSAVRPRDNFGGADDGVLASDVTTRSPIRGVLIGGLLVLFVLWVATGYELIRSLADAERRVSEVHAEFIRGEETLSAIRTSVLLGSIYLRDALIDVTDKRQYYRDELRRIQGDIEKRLPQLSSPEGLGGDQHELKEGLDRYWQTLDLFLGPDAPTNFVQGTGVLRRQVVPARTNVLDIVDRLADLQRLGQRERESEATALYATVWVRIAIIAFATLVVGAVIALIVVRRVDSLERELQRRRAAELRHKRDLQRLSARLVDAQEQERRALARELHDEVGQALTALKMEVGIALRAGENDPSIRQPLEEARAIAESTLHGVRDLSQLLHPSILDDFGLPATIDAYVRSFSKRTGIRTDVNLSGLHERLPAGVEVAVYRIIQEALTNVARHSHATSALVDVTVADNRLQLIIDDDGSGIQSDDAVTAPRGLGVIGMRERAQSLSGTLSIEPRLTGGTRVNVVIPLTPLNQGEGTISTVRIPA